MNEWLDDRSVVEQAICGALKSAIDAHGPIGRSNVSSAGKRVYSALLQARKRRRGRKRKKSNETN